MNHPFAKARNAGHKMTAKYRRGGAVIDAGADSGEGRLEKAHSAAHSSAQRSAAEAEMSKMEKQSTKAIGKVSKARLDKKSRGGFMKPPKAKGFRNPKGPKMPHVHIETMNVNQGATPAEGAAPMVPEEPMAPPTGKLGAGIPGLSKRGGKIRVHR